MNRWMDSHLFLSHNHSKKFNSPQEKEASQSKMSHSLNVTSILIVCYIPIFNGNFRTFYVNQEFEKKVLCESFIDQPSRLGDIFDWDAVSQIL